MSNTKRPQNQNEIKVIYYTDSSIIGEKIFNPNISLSEIFAYFQNNLKTTETHIKSNYSLNGKDVINKSTSISDLINKNKNIKPNNSNQIELKIEVEEYYDLDGREDEAFDKILIPSTKQPFQLIIYQPLDNSIEIKNFPENILLKYNLNKFDESSAYLNIKNYLFLSNNEILCMMDKNNFETKKYKMPIIKKNHSMLYIPDNFIFFAGGNSLETFFFDIEKSEFIQWGKMNTRTQKPALFLYGDYIYSFNSFNDNNLNNNYFERTNITSKNNRWEKIFPEYDGNIEVGEYISSSYGVSKASKGNILLIGGKGSKCLLYSPLNNKLFFSNNENNVNLILGDKNFYKINDLYSIGIPIDFFQNKKIGLLNKKNNSLFYVNYNEITSKLNEKLIGKIEIKTSEKNKINKKASKIKNNKNDNNNSSDTKKEKQDKQENQEKQEKLENNNIINCDIIHIDFNDINEEEEIKYNNVTKKDILYLPDSILNSQIISREVDLNNIHTDLNYSNDTTEDINNKKDQKIDIIKIDDLNCDNGDLMNSTINDINNYPKRRKNILYIHESVLNDNITKRELITTNDTNSNTTNTTNNNKVKIYKKLKVISSLINNNNLNQNTINTINSSRKYNGSIIESTFSNEEEQDRNNTARNSKRSANNSISINNVKNKNVLNIGNKTNRNSKKEVRRIKIDLIPCKNKTNIYDHFYLKKYATGNNSKEKIKKKPSKEIHKKLYSNYFMESDKIYYGFHRNKGENISHQIIRIPRKKFCLSPTASDNEDSSSFNKKLIFDTGKLY